jgi:hypothetical protein
MNDVYIKQNEQIPVEITLNGAQPFNSAVTLSKVDYESNLTQIDSIKIVPVLSSNKLLSSKCLTCDIQNTGRFKVFINCTNLTEGFYKLSVNTPNIPNALEPFDLKKKSKYFYLTNISTNIQSV